MKKLIILTTFILLTSIVPVKGHSQNQNDIKIGQYYELTKTIRALEVEVKSNEALFENNTEIKIDDYVNAQPSVKSKGIRVELPKNALFKILRLDSSKQLFVIQIFDIAELEGRLFGLTELQMINYARLYDGDKPKWSFVSTIVTIPIKIRPGDGKKEDEKKRYFDFEGNVNIGLTAGIRRRISSSGTSYLSLFGGISIGTAKLTTDNSDVTSESNISTLTPFIGLMYEYNDFEIGVFTGWDHASGKIGRSWDYNALPWIGVGLGYNIFTTKNNNPQ